MGQEVEQWTLKTPKSGKGQQLNFPICGYVPSSDLRAWKDASRADHTHLGPVSVGCSFFSP